MIATLHPAAALARDLADFLSNAGLDTAAVAARIGSVTHDPGVPLPLDISPSRPGIAHAQLSRYPKSGLPYVLSLSFEPAQRPDLDDLKAAFGEPIRVRTDRGNPPAYAFDAPEPTGRCAVVLLAELDAGRVATLEFRRDIAGDNS
jgi:hypothetical protein